MKHFFKIVLAAAALLAGALQTAYPQDGRSRRGYLMAIRVDEKGDTTFLDNIDPVWIFPRGRKMKKGDWRKEYKLVYNFNKVYPYALVGRKMMAQVDSTIAADVSKKSERKKYIDQVEKELFRLFEKDIRKMTISQGMVLLRLVDRECGMNGYEIIKTYENGFAAGFWQMVARIFSHDLKTRYDPKGKDARIEELVRIWDSGEWNSFYFSIFFENPQKTVIQRENLESTVEKKNVSKSGRQKTDKANRQSRTAK